MNKFELNELKASAMTYVAHTIQYSIESAQEDYKTYHGRALEETEEGQDIDPDSYWNKQAIIAQCKLDIWNEFAMLLEKKLK